MSRSPNDNIPELSGRAWVDIDCQAWRRNYKAIQDNVAPAEVAPVIKADAYGLGSCPAARCFREAGAGLLIVSCLQEAQELQDIDADVLILGAPLAEEIPAIVANNFLVTVPDTETAVMISDRAKALGRTARAHVNVDTGMGRLGLDVTEAVSAIQKISGLPALKLEGIYSHFPAAGRQDPPTLRQIDALAGIINDLAAAQIHFRHRHIANSTATAGLSRAKMSPYNLVRCGLDLHGAHLSITARPYETTPVLTLKSRLVAVRHHRCGATVGYGRTYSVTEPAGERIGVVAIGYADGYPRSLSNRGHMLVRGRSCPVVGRVCMDYTMVSLKNVPDAQRGDEVVVIGNQRGATIPLAEVARAAETIPYEIICMLGRRVLRRYTDGACIQEEEQALTEAVRSR